MPSEKILEQKKQQVAALVEKLNAAVSGVIVDYKGINVADDTQLRKQLREAGVDYFVVKNTLLSLAADQAGLEGIKDVTAPSSTSTASRNCPSFPLGRSWLRRPWAASTRRLPDLFMCSTPTCAVWSAH